MDVWFVRTAALTDAEAASAKELLSGDECERQRHFRTETLRRDFAIRRALVRLALSHEAGVDPRAWTFGTIGNGRPCIVSPAAGELDFNVSDTKGLIAVVIARGVRAAIDVEHLGRQTSIERMARRYFSAEEQQALFALDEPRRHRRFLELWTAKEAYVKALGTGVAHGFRGFSIRFDPLRVDGGWHLEQPVLGDDYLATVAMRGDARPLEIRDAISLFTG